MEVEAAQFGFILFSCRRHYVCTFQLGCEFLGGKYFLRFFFFICSHFLFRENYVHLEIIYDSDS